MIKTVEILVNICFIPHLYRQLYIFNAFFSINRLTSAHIVTLCRALTTG